MKPCQYLECQEKCEYYDKATFFDRCMHLKFGEYCGDGFIFKIKDCEDDEDCPKK